MTLHSAYDIATGIVTVSSLAYSFLPPWENFADYPRFQRWYKFAMIFVVRWASANVRTVVFPKIQATSNVGGTDTPATSKPNQEENKPNVS